MNYSLEWDGKAYNFLSKLPENICERILKKLDDVMKNPFRYIEHYEGNRYKLRIGIIVH